MGSVRRPVVIPAVRNRPVRKAGSPLVPAGLIMNGNWTGPSGSWTQIPPYMFSIHGDAPLTVPVDAGLRISGTGLARITLVTATSSGVANRAARYLINGVPNTESTTLYSPSPWTQTFNNVLLKNGDIVIPEYRNNGSITSQRTFVYPTSILIEPM